MAYRMDGAPGKMFPEIPFHPREQTLLDPIIAYPYAEEIKAFWAGNIAHFYIPDSPQDILHMILKSV